MGQAMNKSIRSDIDWDSLSEPELDALERQIASKYMHIVPWGAVACWDGCQPDPY